VSNVSSGGDLRKKLLKSEQAKSTSRKTRAQDAASPAVSRFASPVITIEEPNGEPFIPTKRSPKINNVFFTNTTFYTLTRLIEVCRSSPYADHFVLKLSNFHCSFSTLG
jgi:paired amphipathic helix protein Sin3a